MRNCFKKVSEIPWRDKIVGSEVLMSLQNCFKKVSEIPWRDKIIGSKFVMSLRNWFRKASQSSWYQKIVQSKFALSLRSFFKRVSEIPWRRKIADNKFVRSLRSCLMEESHTQRRERLTEKSFMMLLFSSVFGIVICATCLTGLTLAFFSTSVTVSSNKITASNFSISSVVITPKEAKSSGQGDVKNVESATKQSQTTTQPSKAVESTTKQSQTTTQPSQSAETTTTQSQTTTQPSKAVESATKQSQTTTQPNKAVESATKQSQTTTKPSQSAETTTTQLQTTTQPSEYVESDPEELGTSEPIEEPVIEAEQQEDGTFFATLTREGNYTVEINAGGTGSGYCIINYGDEVKRTESFEEKVFSFSVNVEGKGTQEIVFTPVWGTPSNSGDSIKYGGTIDVALKSDDSVEAGESQAAVKSVDGKSEETKATSTDDEAGKVEASSVDGKSEETENLPDDEVGQSVQTAVDAAQNSEQGEATGADGASINKCIAADSTNTRIQCLEEGEYKDLDGAPLIDGQINWQPGDWVCKQLRIKNLCPLATRFSIGIDEDTFAANYVLTPNLEADSDSYPYLGTYRSVADVLQVAVYPGTFNDLAAEVKEKTGKELSGREVIDEAISAGILPIYTDLPKAEDESENQDENGNEDKTELEDKDKHEDEIPEYYFAPIGGKDSYQTRRYTGVLAPAGNEIEGVSVVSEESDGQPKTYENVTDSVEVTFIAYWIPESLSSIGVLDSDYSLENGCAASESTSAEDLYDFNSYLPKRLKEEDASYGGLYINFTLKVCAD